MFVHYMSLRTMSKQVNVLQNLFTVLIELLMFTLVTLLDKETPTF